MPKRLALLWTLAFVFVFSFPSYAQVQFTSFYKKPTCDLCDGCGDTGSMPMPGEGGGGPNGSRARRNPPRRLIPGNAQQKEESKDEFLGPEYPDYGVEGTTNAPVSSPVNPDSSADACGDQLVGLVTVVGRYHLYRLDSVIPGRGGLDWRFNRTYMQGKSAGSSEGVFNTRFGNGWSFPYMNRIDLSAGPAQVSLFESGRQLGGIWQDFNNNGIYDDGTGEGLIQDGENRRLFRNTDGSYDFVELNGTTWHYEYDATVPNSARLSWIRDREGNTLDFIHGQTHPGEPAAPADALTTVIDTLGRVITYHYYSAPGQAKDGKLWKVRDFLGREIVFDYDGNGNLISARSPVVTQTYAGGSNTFPSGKTELYGYTQFSGYGEWLLTTITRPNETNPNYGMEADGTFLVENHYVLDGTSGEIRVDWQKRGPVQDVFQDPLPSPVNQLTFSYLDTNSPQWTGPSGFNPNLEDAPDLQVTVTDRNGNQSTFWSASWVEGLTRCEIQESDVLDGTGPPTVKTLATRYKYLTSFQVEKITYPNGRQIEYSYETPTDPFLPSGSNPILVTEYPGSTADPITGVAIPNAQPSRVLSYSYEPIFNQALSATDERGNTVSYYYDFMEGDVAAVTALAAQYRRPLSSGQIAALALDSDLNGDGIQTQQRGKVIRIEEPTVSLDPSSPQVAIQGDTSQEIWRVAVYDDFGQPTFSVDAEGNIDQYLYYPETDPDGDGAPTLIHPLDPTPPTDTTSGGWVKEIVRDISLASSGLSGSVLPPKHQTAAAVDAHFFYKWSPVGNQTEFTNPNGIVYQDFFNELNEVYRELSAVGTAEEQESLFEFDANGNQIRSFVRNTVSEAGPYVETQCDFDIQDRKVASRAEITQSGGTPVFAETLFGLDGNGNLVRLKKPEGNETSWSYNARNKAIFMRRGMTNDPENARSEYFYDSGGNLVLSVQHTEGVADTLLKHFTLFDGYDRMVGSVDPVGTRMNRTLDAASNPVYSEIRGYLSGPSPTVDTGVYSPLQQSYTDFDERNRAYRVKHQLLNHAGHATGDASGQIVEQFAFDRLGRQTYRIEHPVDGDTSKKYRSEYDGRSRVVKRTDSAGNTTVHSYDENDNLVESTETDLASLAGFPAEAFTTTIYYDALDRQTQIADNLGNTRRMQYDGQNNVIFFSDANGPLPQVLPRRTPALGTYIANLHGNVTHFTYDGLSRLKEKRLRLTATGRGDGTSAPPIDPNQAGDGYITVTSVWDQNSRLVQQIDDAGNITEYAYDALDRKQLATYAKGTSAQTSESWIYDGADRVTKTIDQNGTQVGSVYDLASRLSSKSLLVQGSTPLVGTLSQSFEWDGLGRLTKATDDNGSVPVLFDRAYDSLGRMYLENQTVNGAAYTTEGFWKGEGLRWNFLFPNGRSMLSTFDNMNRLKTLDGGIGYEYVGQGRVLERSFPNGTALSYRNGLSMLGYDGARRVRAQRHVTTGSGTAFVDFEYTHDREGHRKTARRFHEMNGGVPNKPMGELYDYDSAYRLIRWDEGWITKSGSTGTTGFVQGRGDFTTSPGQGAFPYTVKVLQDGGYPIGSYNLTIDIQDARDGQYFGLDGVGNWEQMMRQDIMIGNAVSEHNAYTDWGGTPQAYDTNGNLADDGNYLYQYDFINRLRVVKLKSTQAVIASYEYDAMNRRVTKTVSGTTTRFLYDGWHAVEERVSGAVTKQFVYGQSVDEILKMDQYTAGSISATYYYHADVLGSVVAITNSSGNVVERVKYSPYGQPYWMDANSNILFDGSGNFVNASSVGNPLLFTAARYDAETANRTGSQITDATGLYYLRNRYLDSDKGRFITRDPIGIWGDDANLGGGYSYCGNDPVNGTDPGGLKKCKTKEDEEKERKEKLKKLKKYHLKLSEKYKEGTPEYNEALDRLISYIERLESTREGRRLLADLVRETMSRSGVITEIEVEFISSRSGTESHFDRTNLKIVIDTLQVSNMTNEIQFRDGRPDSTRLITADSGAIILAHEIVHAITSLNPLYPSSRFGGSTTVGGERESFAIRVENQVALELGRTEFRDPFLGHNSMLRWGINYFNQPERREYQNRGLLFPPRLGGQ